MNENTAIGCLLLTTAFLLGLLVGMLIGTVL
jgi:hypothetical protein